MKAAYPHQKMAPLLLLIAAAPVVIADMSIRLFGILAIACLISRFMVDPKGKSIFSARFIGGCVAAVVVYLTWEWYATGLPLVIVLGHFFVLLGACKLIGVKHNRDYGQIFIIAALMMLVAAITSGRLVFPLALTAFLFLNSYCLIDFHFKHERDRLNRARIDLTLPHVPISRASTVTPPAGRISWGISGATVAIMILLFILIPRIERDTFRTLSVSRGPAMTGFSTNVNTQPFGIIRSSDRIVMRVQLTRDGNFLGQKNYQPYFRGITSDRYFQSINPFTGLPGRQTWGRSADIRLNQNQAWVEFAATKQFIDLVNRYSPEPTESLIYQEYWIGSPRTDVMFTMNRPVKMQCTTGQFRRRIDDQTISLVRHGRTDTHYSVASSAIIFEELADALLRERNAYQESPNFGKTTVLHHPPSPIMTGVVSDRVIELAKQIASSCANPENRIEVALAIRRYLLSGDFEYSLDRSGFDPGVESIEQFLFERKVGFCVDYAQSMAVLCQSLGIPARVVSGYHGGEFNEVGQFYVVREKYAHSWVEVYVPGKDWVMFDPTPAQDEPESDVGWFANSLLRKYLDNAQFQWSTSILGYDQKQRRKIFDGINSWIIKIAPDQNTSIAGQVIHRLRRHIFGKKNYDRFDWFLHYTLLALEGVLIVLLYHLAKIVLARSKTWIADQGGIRTWLSQRGPAGRRPDAVFYDRIMRYLAKMGYRRHPGQTPLEFAEQIHHDHPDCASLIPAVHAYYQVQFGNQSLTSPQRDQVDRCLRFLASQPNRSTKTISG